MKNYVDLCNKVKKSFNLKKEGLVGVRRGDIVCTFYYSKYYTLHYFVGVCFSLRKKKRLFLSNLKKGVSMTIPCDSKRIFCINLNFVSLKNKKGEDGIRTRGHLKKNVFGLADQRLRPLGHL
jgi:hypothetical protein